MKFEWKEVELSEIADLTVGFVGTMTRHYTDEGVLFLRSTNIEPFNIKMDDIKYISPEFNEQIKKSELKTDDVVIVRTGKPGACTVIPPKGEPWNCSDLVVIHPNKEKVNPYYLAAYINLASGVINANLVGAVQQHFNVGSAKKMKIQLPSLQIQNRIASIIQGLNKKIALNNKINENLEQQAQALFKAWFVDFIPFGRSVPKNWKNLSFSEFLTVSTEKSDDQELMLFSVTDTGIYPRNKKFKKNLSMQHAKNKVVRQTDLVFGMSRQILNWGVMKYLIGAVSSAYNVYRVDSHINSLYLESYIKSHIAYFKDLIKPASREGQGIDKNALMQKKLLLPPDDILNKYYDMENVFITLIENIRKENQCLEVIRDILLPKLMNDGINITNVDF